MLYCNLIRTCILDLQVQWCQPSWIVLVLVLFVRTCPFSRQHPSNKRSFSSLQLCSKSVVSGIDNGQCWPVRAIIYPGWTCQWSLILVGFFLASHHWLAHNCCCCYVAGCFCGWNVNSTSYICVNTKLHMTGFNGGFTEFMCSLHASWIELVFCLELMLV